VALRLARGEQVKLVVASPADDLDRLTDRARKAVDSAEFLDVILPSKGTDPALFDKIATHWGVNPGAAWAMLTRITVLHHPAASLQKTLEVKVDALLDGDPLQAVTWLRGWIDTQVQKDLTGPIVRQALSQAGFPVSLLRQNKGALDELEATVKRASRRAAWDRPLAPDGTVLQVESPDGQRLLDLLMAPDGPQIVVVHGRAGSGKSTVVAEALPELHQEQGWFAAAVSMEGKAVEARSAIGLGAANDLSRSPAVLLGGMTAGSDAQLRAVLVIDQLDAVSQYGGRMPAAFEAVGDVLDQVAVFPAVKVVLAVRTVDLREDRRIAQILTDGTRSAELELTPLDPERLRTALEAAGVNAGALSPETIELLRVPLHLAVFTKISAGARVSWFSSLSDLYEKYTDEVWTRMHREYPSLDWRRIISLLVEAMSKRQRLQVPVSVLGSVPPDDVRALVSAGVLDVADKEVRFFHETYFDHQFATTLVAGGRSLHSFLVEEGQELFRRAQTRQVLEYLESTDPVAFRGTVVELLTSHQIRPHLKSVVATVLTRHLPDADDWLVLEPVAFGADPATAAWVRPLLSWPGWFEAADAAGRVEMYLRDSEKADVVMRWLMSLPKEAGGRVSELLRPYVGTTDEWRQRFRVMAQWAMTPALVDLMVDVIGSGDLDGGPPGASTSNADFFTNLYGLHTEDPAAAARLIGAVVHRAVECSAAASEPDPFTSGLLPDNSPGSDQLVEEVAGSAPAAYLSELLESMIEMIQNTAVPSQSGGLSQSARWAAQPLGGRDGLPGSLYTGLDKALRAVAVADPDSAAATVTPLAASNVEELRWLACRTYQVLGRCDEGLSFLKADPRNLNLGYFNSPRWASRELVAAIAASCTKEQLGDLDQMLIDYELPSWARSTPDAGEWRERGSYELLTAVPVDRRSTRVAQRIADLEAKYADLEIHQPQPIPMARPIGSPILEDDSKALTDDQWLAAIARYPELHSRGMEGGAYQLASQLGRRAAAEPKRFANLALRLDSSAPAVHLLRIISAIAPTVDLGLLSQVCVHAFEVAGPEVLRTVNDAIEARGAADEGLLALLEHGAREEDSKPGPYSSGDAILTAGINSIPGTSARAIATLWFASDEHVGRLLPSVEVLATAESLATRSMAAEAIAALLNHDRDTALNIADLLFQDVPSEIFQAHTVGRLLVYCLIRDQDRFAPHLLRALDGPLDTADVAGEIWASALRHDFLGTGLPTAVTALSADARHGAARRVAESPLEDLDIVETLLNDAEPAVRKEAAKAATALASSEQPDAEALLKILLSSPVFDDCYLEVIDALADRSQVLPPSTIEACERAAVAGGIDIGNMATAPARIAQDLSRVIFRLYQQSDSAADRNRCLDVIDQLADARAYGLSELLDSQR
jgi:hypothetical protein